MIIIRSISTNANLYIENCEVYEGEYTRKALKEAKEWWNVEANKKLLEQKWKEFNERG
jgi:hypothetical protein